MELEHFKNNLEELIRTHGYNARTFSIAIGIPAPTISRYLTGDRQPDIPYVIKIAKFFHVSVDWLLGLDLNYTSEITNLIDRYNRADDADKYIVNTILNKYVHKNP